MGEITIPTEKLVDVGSNIKLADLNGRLIFVVDLAKDIGLTPSRGSLAIASSHSFRQLHDGIRYNMWVGRKLCDSF